MNTDKIYKIAMDMTEVASKNEANMIEASNAAMVVATSCLKPIFKQANSNEVKIQVYDGIIDMFKDYLDQAMKDEWCKFFKQLFRENFNLRWVSFKEANFTDKIFEEIKKNVSACADLVVKRLEER